jgi:hypothetical protein
MSDAYGTLILHTSKEIDCDYDGLVSALNKFIWSNSLDTWKKYGKDDNFYIDLASGWGIPQYPTVFPSEILGVVSKDEKGIIGFIANPTDEDIKDAWDLKLDDDPSLERISKQLAQHIQKGHIEISCVANEKAHYSYMEILTIRSDGSASRSRTASGGGSTDEFRESYPEDAI